MQESTTIQWEAMPEGHLPWSTRLFVIYLAGVLLVLCFAVVRMVWQYRSLRHANLEAGGSSWLAWNSCHARVVSMKNWSALTFLLSFLVFAWNMTETLRGISAQKLTDTAFLAGTTAEILVTFCFGMLVCVILYGVAFFCETLLSPYKSRQSSSSR